MITIRPAEERGHADHGWLDTYHSFSFASYYHPEHMGFRSLRVLNDDFVEPGRGFATHGHENMEIVSYVLEGSQEHQDTTGGHGVLRAGEVLRMTAGRGVRHSEFNASTTERLRLFQIWILPAEQGLEPSYESREFSADDKRGRLRLVVSPDGRDGSLRIHQDAEIHGAILEPGDRVEHELRPGRGAWIQVARGAITLNGRKLREGDGAAVEREPSIAIEASEATELVLIDLA